MPNQSARIIKVLRSPQFWARMAFIALSALLWLFIKLGKTGYVTTITHPITYTNLPANKVLAEDCQKEVQFRVNVRGFRFLSQELRNLEPIVIDVKRYARKFRRDENTYYWLTNLNREELITGLDARTTLLRIDPDTLFIRLHNKSRKRVPVMLNLSARFAPGFALYKPVELNPAEVVVTGDEAALDTLKHIATEMVELVDITEGTARQVGLLLPSQGLEVKPEQVAMTLDVERFTEKKMSVPVTLRNVPAGEKVSISPDRVEVVVRVAMRDYKKLTPSSIHIICDLAQLRKHPDRNTLALEVRLDLPHTAIMRQSCYAVDYLRFVP